MKKYQTYKDFTAQSFNVQALMKLYAGLEREPESESNLVPIVVFLAFSVESYLNSLGAAHLEIWDELEKLPWRSKVEILHKVAGKNPDWGKEPLQFATEIFKLRDKLAHGKPERMTGPITSIPPDLHDHSAWAYVPEWYAGITVEWALKAKGRFRALMAYLAALFGLHESDHLRASQGGILTIEDT